MPDFKQFNLLIVCGKSSNLVDYIQRSFTIQDAIIQKRSDRELNNIRSYCLSIIVHKSMPTAIDSWYVAYLVSKELEAEDIELRIDYLDFCVDE